MNFFGKKAGKLLGNAMKDLIPPHQDRQPDPGQPQLQRNQQSDFFQQPFGAPPLNEGNSLPFEGGQLYHDNPPEPDSQFVNLDGTLEALRLPDANNNTIPDFSRVGYRQGHVRIPNVPVRMALDPSPYPDQDDTARIQAAIDQVSTLPLESTGPDGEGGAVRGAVLLRAGVYRCAGALVIHSSGVILRGEGQDESGTILVATGAIQRDFLLVNGMLTSEMGSVEFQQSHGRSKEMMPTNGYGSKKINTQTRSDKYIPVGETHLPVENTAGFQVGGRIVIERPGSDEWLDDIGMAHLPPRPGNTLSAPWKKETFTFRFERTVVGIDPGSQLLTLDIPLVMSLDPRYPPASVYVLNYKVPMISDVGVENLRLLSESDPIDAEDESHGWYAVVLDNVLHGWVADVTTMHFVSGIFCSTWSRFITIQDCSVLYPISKPKEGGRRYQFNLSGQMGLVKRCFTNNARHDFITLARVCGPNVFVDSTGVDANNDTGPHERWAMGTLYDNITCNTINVRQRLWLGSGHGWAGAYQVVYNCTALGRNSCFQDAPGVTNWIIGFKGRQTNKPEFEGRATSVMAANTSVEPRSLYWAQLIARMGGEAERIERTVGSLAKNQYPPRL